MRMLLKRGLALFAVALLTLGMSVQGAFAQEQRVFDDAELFSETELAQLETQVETIRQEIGMDLVIVTTPDARGKSAVAYADDYYDQNGFGTGSNKSGALFLIDMDNRELYISTAGDMILYLTDERIESILDEVYVSAQASDFSGAALAFLSGIRTNVAAGIEDNQHMYDTETGEIIRHRSVSVLQLVIFALISLGAGGAVCLGVKAKYQMKTSQYRYPVQERSNFALINQADDFVNQTVTTRQIPRTPPPSSGGGGGGSSAGRSSVHRSSGGVRHGGGGRKF